MPLKDGYNELTGPYELIEVKDGVPVRYASLTQVLPTPDEAAHIAGLIEAMTGYEVRLEQWEIEEGDPRDSGRHATVVVVEKRTRNN